MPDALLSGITGQRVETRRLTAAVLERPGYGAGGAPVLFIHGNVSSSLFWQPTMLRLPSRLRALAVDLRGFGGTEAKPVDATRGLRDFSDDVAAVLEALDVAESHLVGWSMGAGVALQLLLDHPERVRSLTLVSPLSPYGFGGTAGADGHRLTTDDAGAGAGGANPDFVARLDAQDRTDDAPTSPRSVYRSSYVRNPEGRDHEDLWVTSMLSTATGLDSYPGDAVGSDSWPGFAAGTRGVLNAMAPRYCDTSGIVDLDVKPPVLWIRGHDDVIVSDTSLFDLNHLGALGVVPGWPGADVAPAQPMVAQTRAVLDAYAAAGGSYRELVLADCGHSPHLEHPQVFDEALAAHVAG